MKPTFIKFLFLFYSASAVCFSAAAQLNPKFKTLEPTLAQQFLDSQAIYLPSLSFYKDRQQTQRFEVSPEHYVIQFDKNIFVWLTPPTDTLYLFYQVFPFALKQVWQPVSYTHLTLPTKRIV